MSNISSPMKLKSNIKLLMLHMVLKEWLIILTPLSLGSTFSLAHPLSRVAMAKFSSEDFQALFKYPCNIKDNLYNNQGSLCYCKGNLCCSKGF